jgi:hypothetical protein
MENKIIGGISLDKWKEAFGRAAIIAMDQDYFSDILFFDLYPNIHEETANADEEAIRDIYKAKWDFANKAFKEVFGFSRYE